MSEPITSIVRSTTKSLLLSVGEKIFRLIGGLITAILLTRVLVTDDIKLWTYIVAITTFFISILEFGQREKIIFDFNKKQQYNPLYFTRLIGIIFLVIIGLFVHQFWLFLFPAISLSAYHYSVGRQIAEYHGYTDLIRREAIIRIILTLLKVLWVLFAKENILFIFICIQSLENFCSWMNYKILFTEIKKDKLKIVDFFKGQNIHLFLLSLFMLAWIKLDKVIVFYWDLDEASIDYISSLRIVESSFPILMVLVNTKFNEIRQHEVGFYQGIALLVVLICIDHFVGISSFVISEMFNTEGVNGSFATSHFLLIPLILLYEYIKRCLILDKKYLELLVFSLVISSSFLFAFSSSLFSMFRTIIFSIGLVYLMWRKSYRYIS